MYENTTWIRVSKHHPCLICSRPNWCAFSSDGAAALCMRQPSPIEVDCKGAGIGFIHKLNAHEAPRLARIARAASTRPKPTLNAAALHSGLLAATSAVQIAECAAGLGVTPDGLRRLGFAWYSEKEAWAIPMRSAEGEIIGLRLRTADGKKWAVAGSHQGLFLADGSFPDLATSLCLVEGPTDCAAMLSLGFHDVVGRPSCSGGHDLVLPLAAGRDVVIIADRDEPKLRPDGTTWFPGAEGAERLAAALLPVTPIADDGTWLALWKVGA